MNLYAASILIPVGVIMYTAHGGLKVRACQLPAPSPAAWPASRCLAGWACRTRARAAA